MRKRSTMYVVMLGAWGLTLLYFNPRFLALLIGPEPLMAKLMVVLYVLLSNLLWLYTCYHLVIVGYSYIYPYAARTPRQGSPFHATPAVALLYTTCNDFQEAAAQAHLTLDYPNYHLFLLDDSNRHDYRARVDAFAQQHPNRVTVIRRGARVGF